MSGASGSDAARRKLGEAADAAAEFGRLAGAVPAPDAPSTAWRVPAEASVRAALDGSRARVLDLEEQLASARREADAARAENRALVESLEREAADAAGAEEARVLAAEAEARAVSLKERATLMEAECVRLESMRRKAERAAADAEAAGRAVEESLRRELRKANAALDRAAAESGALEARTKSEGEALRVRLDSASARLQAFERERRLEVARGSGDASALQAELQRALAVAAALRQEAAAARAAADQREEALRRELADAVDLEGVRARAAAAEASWRAIEDGLRREVRDANSLLERAGAGVASLAAADRREEALRGELAQARSSLDEALGALSQARVELDANALRRALPAMPDDWGSPDAGEPDERLDPPAFTSPPVEPVLDPGWSRLLRLVRPPVESAYAHLRRLSATALTAGQKALLRMAAASIAQASDSLASVGLALEDGPSPEAPSPVIPVVEASLAAWETPFRRRGVSLVRELPAPLPAAAHDAKEMRILLYHVLRNALEALPRGGRLVVRGGRGSDGGLRLECFDDGPGFPAEWLARRFEPFAAPRRGRAGLGLSLVRRTLRRWGGDAEASNGPSGRGAQLTLIFPPAPPPGPAPFSSRAAGY
jgi:signal transduction histidine kinase